MKLPGKVGAAEQHLKCQFMGPVYLKLTRRVPLLEWGAWGMGHLALGGPPPKPLKFP